MMVFFFAGEESVAGASGATGAADGSGGAAVGSSGIAANANSLSFVFLFLTRSGYVVSAQSATALALSEAVPASGKAAISEFLLYRERRFIVFDKLG
jgi:hypothetical protein